MKKKYLLVPMLLLSLQSGVAAAAETTSFTAPSEMQKLRGTAQTVQRTAERNAELAQILGMNVADFTKLFSEGKTFQDIIVSQGLSIDVVLEKLKAQRKLKVNARIDADVASGKITQTEADALKNAPQPRLDAVGAKRMSMQGMMGNKFGNDTGKRPLVHKKGMGPLEPLAKILGTTKEDLEAQMKAGKTIDEIITAKGLTKDAVMAQLKTLMPPHKEGGRGGMMGGPRKDGRENGGPRPGTPGQ
ncbi:MAG: hypothetical protein WAX38_01485 [Minisyncoccia bacterium]